LGVGLESLLVGIAGAARRKAGWRENRPIVGPEIGFGEIGVENRADDPCANHLGPSFLINQVEQRVLVGDPAQRVGGQGRARGDVGVFPSGTAHGPSVAGVLRCQWPNHAGAFHKSELSVGDEIALHEHAEGL
jgi:hypothetical protein